MGWIIMWVVLFVLLSKSGSCRHKHRHRHPAAADYYRMQADLEDMTRRMQSMERVVDPHDDWLAREIRKL